MRTPHARSASRMLNATDHGPVQLSAAPRAPILCHLGTVKGRKWAVVDPAPRGVAITPAPALPLWAVLLRCAFHVYLAVSGSF